MCQPKLRRDRAARAHIRGTRPALERGSSAGRPCRPAALHAQHEEGASGRVPSPVGLLGSPPLSLPYRCGIRSSPQEIHKTFQELVPKKFPCCSAFWLRDSGTAATLYLPQGAARQTGGAQASGAKSERYRDFGTGSDRGGIGTPERVSQGLGRQGALRRVWPSGPESPQGRNGPGEDVRVASLGA